MTAAFILAAGRGERMRPLTDRTPKPLLEVGGRALIEHHLLRLCAAGIERVVINLGWLGAQIRERLGDGRAYGMQIAYSDEGWPALDTGGGIHRALPLLDAAPFVLVNADVWCELPLAGLRERAERWPADALAHLVLVPNPPQHPHGDFALDGDRVHESGQAKLTYSGQAVLHPRLFEHCAPGRFSLIPVLRAAMRRGAVSGERYDGVWADIGTPQRLAALSTRLSSA
ncbi:N-acetylmuramate alpha-1-phosphate uridylyltransferase MurU [Sinimarinibacterium thermocellulolyticum]|uniref:N-acetylmuramate alpha-1-phosphate uridylyltransferase MurU n=1 Tax=Sinimarinibacterium thermocellulolyticum TaxID=3170016 RepID=A0ABV2A7H0_9GAMM